MGQRRDGLCRIRSLTPGSWDVLVDAPGSPEVGIVGPDKKMQRMGEIYFQLSEKIKSWVERGYVPVGLAGDCVSAIGVLAGLQKANKQPDRIIWLDAHGDFNTWETSQTKYIGGMPLSMLVGRGDQRVATATGLKSYPEDRVILSDARDLDPGEKKELENSRIVRCDIGSITRHLQPNESVYLHWDTDVINAAEDLPALKYHVGSGPTYPELSSLFKSFHELNLIAISVSAWHAEQDTDNKTAIACMRLLSDLGAMES
jgi:arginase